jgi:hypothetical protein
MIKKIIGKLDFDPNDRLINLIKVNEYNNPSFATMFQRGCTHNKN